jgi:hypothetical protein
MDLKDRIQCTTSVIQATAVILGVGFAVNEFVLKDRDAERGKVKISFELIDRGLAESLQKARQSMRESAGAINAKVNELTKSGPIDAKTAILGTMGMSSEVGKFAFNLSEVDTYYSLALSCIDSGACHSTILSKMWCRDIESIRALDEQTTTNVRKLGAVRPKFEERSAAIFEQRHCPKSQ